MSQTSETAGDRPGPEWTHLDAEGRARMVDVSDKAESVRTATARARVELGPELRDRVLAGGMSKGDVLAVARIAGIQAAKETPRLIPLCHPLPLTGVEVTVEPAGSAALEISATVRCRGVTGVEMEALTAVSVAALTVYDMCKAVSKHIRIGPIELLEKTGGRSGTFRRDAPREERR